MSLGFFDLTPNRDRLQLLPGRLSQMASGLRVLDDDAIVGILLVIVISIALMGKILGGFSEVFSDALSFIYPKQM